MGRWNEGTGSHPALSGTVLSLDRAMARAGGRMAGED